MQGSTKNRRMLARGERSDEADPKCNAIRMPIVLIGTPIPNELMIVDIDTIVGLS